MYSLLIVPIQRIPRYLLLLKQLEEHTPAEHPDKAFLLEALEFTSSTMTTLNKKKEEAEATTEILQVQRKITDFKTCLNYDPARRYLTSTELSVNGNKRTIFLFNDLVLITKKTSATPELYRFKGQMLLEICTVHDVTGKPSQFLLQNPEVSLTFKLKTDEEATKWKDLLREGVQYANNKLLTATFSGEQYEANAFDRRTNGEFVKKRLDLVSGLQNTSKQQEEQTTQLLNAFVAPLLKSTDNTSSSLNKATMQGLFDVTQQLLSHYHSVATGLEKRLTQPLLWSDTISDILNLPQLETLLKSYMQHKIESMTAIDAANKNPGFAYWVLELETAEKKSLPQVLQKPLCVISDLILTVEELLAVTPHKNADHDHLHKRLAALRKLERTVSEQLAQHGTAPTSTTTTKSKKSLTPRRL